MSDSDGTGITEHVRAEPLSKLAEALAKAQGALGALEKDRTVRVQTRSGGEYEYSYATLAAVLEAVRQPLAGNGLALVQLPSVDAQGVSVTTLLLHTSGECIRSVLVMPLGDRTPQTIGSAITYGRRYALQALVGVAAEEDDDGSAATGVTATSRARVSPGGPAADLPLPTVFPNFGTLKGTPLRGAPPKDLEWYRGAARKSLADPAKARYHAAELALAKAIDAELARQRAEGPPADPMKPLTVTDVAEGETEEHAKMRSAGGFYAQAVAVGKAAGRKQEETGKWLREKRDRTGSGTVTEADVAAYRAHLTGEPPPDMRLPGQREPGAEG